MKRKTAALCAVMLCVCFVVSACGGKPENATAASEDDGTLNSEPQSVIPGEEPPDATPSPVGVKEGRSKNAFYGKNTGTTETYTGLEPLPQKKIAVNDPNNTRGLSEDAVAHSYGVSKDGVPHDISVQNQKIYEEYGGLCFDTSGEKVIYLTFDCGYENGVTPQILDTLKLKKVPAAFFVTGQYIKSSPEIVTRMINEGHTVGNHSDTHPNFAKITRTQMAKEIETVDNMLREDFGYSAPFFRFPEGSYSENALELVESAGFKSVFWSSSYADWDVNAQKGRDYAYNTVTARLHPGCVLLLHAVSQDNADALGDIIDFARGQGYEFRAL